MFLNSDDYRAEARRLLPRFVFDYVDGAADDGMCLRRNRSDIESLTLTSRVLRDTTTIDTSIEVFGTRWRVPMGIASTGLNGSGVFVVDRLEHSSGGGARRRANQRAVDATLRHARREGRTLGPARPQGRLPDLGPDSRGPGSGNRERVLRNGFEIDRAGTL